MNGRPQEQHADSHDELARRDALVADLTSSHRRLQKLYEISKSLLRFETVAQTVPQVIALVAHSVPLRTAIFVQTSGDLRTLVLQAEGVSPHELEQAKLHAASMVEYLVPRGVEFAHVEPISGVLPPLPSAASSASGQQYVMLPFAVTRKTSLGVLQVAGVQALSEQDLAFVSEVVTQVATALARSADERALRDSEAKLASIMSKAGDAVITTDESMRIAMYNESAERIFGWSAAEALGKPIEILLPPRLRSAHEQHARAFHDGADTARTMGGRAQDIYGLRKNGEEFHADAAISKLNIGGKHFSTVIVRDITARKAIEGELAFLAEIGAVLSGPLEGSETLEEIARLSLRGRAELCVIDFIDERDELSLHEEITSDPDKTEIVHALARYPLDRRRPHLSSLVVGAGPRIITEVSSDLLRAAAQDEEHLRLLEALELRSLMGVPLLVGGRKVGALIVGAWRAGRVFAEADLRLLEEVGRRVAAALESARLYGVAQRAVRLRDDVMSVVAHDLRNPLSAILMQVALLRRGAADANHPLHQVSDKLQRSAKRMDRLIQDLLDIGSIEAGQLSVECDSVPVVPLLSYVLESQQALASSYRLTLRLDAALTRGAAHFDEALDGATIWADRERVLQVLENLVGNAAKFTPAGGTITMGARLRDGKVLFWVTDTGIGVAAGDLPHLFERFWQVAPAARRGAGLGLAIVKGLVESHGGTIWVTSALDHGSTFHFTIPVLAAR